MNSDHTLLKYIDNPTTKEYKITIHCPELTFEGVNKQPDFAELEIIYHPSDIIIELKSLKYYLVSFRDKIISYEHLINIIYDDIIKVYNPLKLILNIKFKPRGGISSVIQIDSTRRDK